MILVTMLKKSVGRGMAVLIGGTIGAYYGSSRLPVAHLKRLLAAVLLLAGTKLLLEG